MKTPKRILSLFLTVALVSTSACGRSATASTQTSETTAVTLAEPASQTEAIRSLEPTLSDQELLVDVAVQGDKVYFLTQQEPETDRLYVIDTDGSGQTQLAQTMEMIEAFCPAFDGGVWYYVPETDAPGGTLVKVDDTGTQTAVCAWDSYVNAMATDAEGNLVVVSDVVTVLDKTGTILGSITGASGYMERLAVSDSGAVLGEYMDVLANQRSVYEIDTQAMTMGQSQEAFPELSVNWTEKGFAQSAVYKAFSLTDGTLLVAEAVDGYANYEGLNLYILPQDYTTNTGEKTVLTLAGYYIDSTLNQQVIAFNRTNADYYIDIVDYAQYDTTEDYGAGAERLLYDITTGDMPDILLLGGSENLSVSTLAEKGYLADLGALLDSDEEINAQDYYQNVWQAASIDGIMYDLIPSFYVYTLAADRAVVGDSTGCSLADAIAWQEAYPEREVFTNVDTSGILRQLFFTYGSQWLGDDGTCDFTQDSFLSALEFVNGLPTPAYDDAYYQTYEANLAEGNFIFATIFADGVYNFLDPVAYWGERTVYVGYPTPEGNGALIQPAMELCVFVDSTDISGCWTFLKSLLSLDFQQSAEVQGLGIPVLKQALTPLTEEIITYMTQTYGISQQALDELEAQAESVIENATVLARCDTAVYDIIYSEAQSYFFGDKTAEQAADNIQSRVSIYMAEQG